MPVYIPQAKAWGFDDGVLKSRLSETFQMKLTVLLQHREHSSLLQRKIISTTSRAQLAPTEEHLKNYE